jgi:hypothetical protein
MPSGDWRDHAHEAVKSMLEDGEHDRAIRLCRELKRFEADGDEDEDLREDFDLEDQGQEGRGKPTKAGSNTADSRRGVGSMESRQRTGKTPAQLRRWAEQITRRDP